MLMDLSKSRMWKSCTHPTRLQVQVRVQLVPVLLTSSSPKRVRGDAHLTHGAVYLSTLPTLYPCRTTSGGLGEFQLRSFANTIFSDVVCCVIHSRPGLFARVCLRSIISHRRYRQELFVIAKRYSELSFEIVGDCRPR